MKTDLDLDDLERKARPIADWDEERDAPDQECVGCRHSMHTPSELESTALCNGCAQAYAATTAPVVLALITRIRELETGLTELLDECAQSSEDPDLELGDLRALVAKGAGRPCALERIAKAATAFVDEQGKRVSIERGHTIGQAEDFAGEQFAELVRAVEAAGR